MRRLGLEFGVKVGVGVRGFRFTAGLGFGLGF